MFCPTCGASIDEGLAFCAYCGAKLNNNEPPQAQPVEAPPSELFSENIAYQPSENSSPIEDMYQQTEPMSAQNQNAPYQGFDPINSQFQSTPAYNYPTYNFSNQASNFEPPKRDPGRVCGILSLIFSLIGYPFLLAYGVGLIYWFAALILGIIGSRASKKNGFKNGRAKAGIIITLIPLIVLLVALLVSVVAMLLNVDLMSY